MLQLLNAFLVSWLLLQLCKRQKCMKWTEDCHWLESKIWSKSLEDVLLRASKELTEVMESLKKSWGGWGDGGLLHGLTNKKLNQSDNKVQIHIKVKTNLKILFSPHKGNAEYYWKEKVGKQQQCCCIHKWRTDVMGCRGGTFGGYAGVKFWAEAQHSQTSHCRSEKCHHLTSFMMSTNMIQQEPFGQLLIITNISP